MEGGNTVKKNLWYKNRFFRIKRHQYLGVWESSGRCRPFSLCQTRKSVAVVRFTVKLPYKNKKTDPQQFTALASVSGHKSKKTLKWSDAKCNQCNCRGWFPPNVHICNYAMWEVMKRLIVNKESVIMQRNGPSVSKQQYPTVLVTKLISWQQTMSKHLIQEIKETAYIHQKRFKEY